MKHYDYGELLAFFAIALWLLFVPSLIGALLK